MCSSSAAAPRARPTRAPRATAPRARSLSRDANARLVVLLALVILLPPCFRLRVKVKGSSRPPREEPDVAAADGDDQEHVQEDQERAQCVDLRRDAELQHGVDA